MSVSIEVSIQQEDFDAGLQLEIMRKENTEVGAIVSFIGAVRDGCESEKIITLELEHYPGMTQRSIRDIVDRAFERWQLLGARVIHRVGKLAPADQIVFVAVSSQHRGQAFDACEFIMDYLKTSAPFWKKELTAQGVRWVGARCSDQSAVERWSR